MARNWGISSAKGQWIAFLDADDLWRPEHLEILNKQIGDNPDVDIVAGGYHPSREVSQWLKSVAGHAPSQARTELITDLPGRWMAGTCFFTSSVAVRRSTLQALPQPFAPGETFGEDLDLWFRLAEHSAVALYPRPLVGYRLGAAGSLTAAHQVTALPPYLVRMRERGLSGYPDERKARASLRFVAEQQINFARDCLAKGLRKNAVAWLAGAGRDGWRVRRWWVTVLMTLAPASVIRRWQKNRIQAGATQDD